MRLNSEGRLSTAIPIWVQILLIVALGARVAIKILDKETAQTKCRIDWRNPEYVKNIENSADPNKLVLFDFTAEWCRPCKQMARTTFLNQSVTELVNKDFDAVRVVDRQVEEKKNPKAIEDLEAKFNVYSFPTITIALRDLSVVSRHSGLLEPKDFIRFLEEAKSNALFVRAKSEMYKGAYQAASGYLKPVDQTKWSSFGGKQMVMTYWHIFTSLGHEDEAKKALDSAEKFIFKKAKTKEELEEWPKPLLKFMRGELSQKELLSEAGDSKFYRTDSYCVIGMKKLQSGDKVGAAKDFLTVIRLGYNYAEANTVAQRYLDVLSPEKDEQ